MNRTLSWPNRVAHPPPPLSIMYPFRLVRSVVVCTVDWLIGMVLRVVIGRLLFVPVLSAYGSVRRVCPYLIDLLTRSPLLIPLQRGWRLWLMWGGG